MQKQMIKKLYTYYTVEGELKEIRNDPKHNLKSYSSGKAVCIKYHDTFADWLYEIISNELKNGFGIKSLTEDGKDSINNHRYDLECNTWTCNNKELDFVTEIMADIITYYFDDDNSYYYEIMPDGIHMYAELTGHQYYRSPYESSDNCGTCDGARCDTCNTKYIVEDFYLNKIYYNGFNKDKAESAVKEYSKDYSDIITDIFKYYAVDTEWFEREIGEFRDMKSLFRLINKYNIPYITID